MTTMKRAPLLVAAAIVAAAVTAGITGFSSSDEERRPGEHILLASASDNLPNQSATDWVTNADHVVTVSAVTEQEVPPAQSEIDRGEGLIGRLVTLKVDQVLWSKPGTTHPAPSMWQRPSMGWQFTEGDTTNRMKMAKEDSPRIEVGHKYLIAITWEADPCKPGSGEWRGLGEGSTLSYDSNTVGQGELEGRTQSAAQARVASDAEDPNRGLEEEMAGKTGTDLARALEAAQPVAAPGRTRTTGATCG